MYLNIHAHEFSCTIYMYLWLMQVAQSDIWLSIHPSIHPFVHPFICPFIHPFTNPTHPFIHSSIHPSHPSIHPSIHPICPSIHTSIRLSIHSSYLSLVYGIYHYSLVHGGIHICCHWSHLLWVLYLLWSHWFDLQKEFQVGIDITNISMLCVYVCVLCIMCICVFCVSVLCVYVYCLYEVSLLSSLPNALITLFQLFTLDQWYKIYNDIIKVQNKVFTCTYILLWVWVGAFVFRNLFVGIMGKCDFVWVLKIHFSSFLLSIRSTILFFSK